MFPFRCVITGTLVIASAVCMAQTVEPSSKPSSDDSKAIRADLDRLVSLQQIQIYESRLGVLETRDDALTQQETELNIQMSSLQRASNAAESGIGPTGAPSESGRPDVTARTAISQQFDTATRQLDTIRSKKQQVEREMTTLRTRLSELEKSSGLDSTN